MGKIHFIRHGTTEANIKKLYYGATDVPLSNIGIDALSAFGLEGGYPSAEGADFYTSGMIRTDQTFFLIYGCKDYQVIPELKEYDFGVFEMKTYEEIKDEPGYQGWVSDEEGLTPCPGGESPTDFRTRVKAGFSRLLAGHGPGMDPAKKTIVISHGGVIANIMDMYFSEEEKNLFQWIPEPGRGYTLHIGEGEVISYETL